MELRVKPTLSWFPMEKQTRGEIILMLLSIHQKRRAQFVFAHSRRSRECYPVQATWDVIDLLSKLGMKKTVRGLHQLGCLPTLIKPQ